jgi:hypothetical protein
MTERVHQKLKKERRKEKMKIYKASPCYSTELSIWRESMVLANNHSPH